MILPQRHLSPFYPKNQPDDQGTFYTAARYVFFRFFTFYIEGLPAGMLAVPLWSLLFALMGIVAGLAAYWPVRWVINLLLTNS